MQVTHDGPLESGSCLPHRGLGRINIPAEATALFAHRVACGDSCLILNID